MSLFDNIDRLAHVAARQVQEEMMRESLEAGHAYTPTGRGISWLIITRAFYMVRDEYHSDKSLSNYIYSEEDSGTDAFKNLLTSVSCEVLSINNSKSLNSEDEERVRILCRILGHIFSWRKNGKFSKRAKEIALAYGYIRKEKDTK